MVASASATSTTGLTGSTLTITDAGSFTYNLTTTSDFVDPTQVATLYAPGAGGDYQCYFSVDAPAAYDLTMRLDGFSLVQFFSVSTGTLIYSRVKSGGLPIIVSTSGTIPVGDYGVRVNASFGPPILPPGVNQSSGSGSFSNFTFSVSVPEPCRILFVLGLVTLLGARIQTRMGSI
jgi:hypothetical protein